MSDEPGGLAALVGGAEGLRELARAFYARVDRDPVLRPMYPRVLNCPTESLALFLAQSLAGASRPGERRPRLSLRESHARFRVGQRERDAWLGCMRGAIDDVGMPEPARTALRGYFEDASAFLVNQPPEPDAASLSGTATPYEADSAAAEAALRWQEQLAVEALVAAVRAGQADEAIRIAGGPPLAARLASDRPLLLSVLGAMGGSGHPALVDHVASWLAREPGLAGEDYAEGRTLLHDAAGGWCPEMVALLLRHGANPHAAGAFGHGPLYAACNAYHGSPAPERGAEVVRLLARAGAGVNAASGVKACTPLHMAARQGHVALAEALLDAGADIEARDDVGDTPLRRAVNCGKPTMAAFLLSRGADAHARGSRGLTPLEAARGREMRDALSGDAG